MIKLVIMVVYRMLAVFIVLTPIIANILFTGSILTSLIYVPVLTLTVAFLLTYLDKKLEQVIDYKLKECDNTGSSNRLTFVHRNELKV